MHPYLFRRIVSTLADYPNREFDTVGHFARNLRDLHYIVSHTFENIPQDFSKFPSKILYPLEFYPLKNSKQQDLTEEFVAILEEFLGVKRTPFSFVEEWEKSPPKQAEGLPLLKYTEKVCLKKIPSLIRLLNGRTRVHFGHYAMTTITDSMSSGMITKQSLERMLLPAQSFGFGGQSPAFIFLSLIDE
jgi:hypothetical protein